MADEGTLPLPPGPEELRASFGDRKPPDISRKITACVACRKLKIKCHMQGSGTPPCSRCKKRGLSCTVNRSLQTLLEDDASWKQTVTRKLCILEAFMETASRKLSLPTSQEENMLNRAGTGATTPQARSRPAEEDHSSLGRQDHEVHMDVDSGPAMIPSSSISEAALRDDAPNRTALSAGDVISDGIVAPDQAVALFDIYANRLDHYLYGILGQSAQLQQIRSSSAILLAAICCVGALHSSELRFLYQPCYQHLQRLASNLSLAQAANLDDIRALCIGAFWLQNLSWSLSSLAVRLSMQTHLHRAFHSTLKGNRASYPSMRLYYTVYVCDHHFSIAYGRSPMTRECEAISRVKELLTGPYATQDDTRLASQVEIWSTTSRVLDALGSDVDTPVPASLIPLTRRFVIALDTWRADWIEKFSVNVHVGDYPRKGVTLHYHFAKLYLCCHAFRGLASHQPRSNSKTPVESPAVPSSSGSREGEPAVAQTRLHPDLEEMASSAVRSAQSILHTIIADGEIQEHLTGLPLYFDTMIAFAIAFLFKIATRYSHVVRIDARETLGLVADVTGVLRTTTAAMHRQHPLTTIAAAVEKLSLRCRAGPDDEIASVDENPGGHRLDVPLGYGAPVDNVQLPSGFDAVGLTPENLESIEFDWANYDFLVTESEFMQGGSMDFGLHIPSI